MNQKQAFLSDKKLTVRILAAAIFMLLSCAALAKAKENGEKINLWGYVVDSFLQTGLEGAKVTLMAADSTVLDTTHTYLYEGNALFHFSLPAKTQDIILRAEQVGYEPGCISMKVRHYKRETEVYAPWINLKKKNSKTEQSLDEVVVTASKVQLVWKGDTAVYNADAFNLPQGSMLDALIRQLPGVTLKEDGEILVNGRKVDYLTLNGADFFRGNNKMMLDNLPYYTVKNIKVYDKSSDISRYLGYEAEKKDYVMDVALKREHSVGLTANVEAGVGTADRWLARAFGLRYADHSRLTVFGNDNNINQTGQPGDDGAWKASATTDGITTHGEANVNLRNEDRYKRWKNELSATYTDVKNDSRNEQESEYYLQGGGEFAHRGHWTLSHDKRIDVTNTFTSDKSTSPIYCTSMVGYRYNHDKRRQQDSARVNDDDGLLYHLDEQNMRRGNNWHVFTANHILVKLPWGDRLNIRPDGFYGMQRSRSFSHYSLDYADGIGLPADLFRRYEHTEFNPYYWQAELEYVFRFPHQWYLDIGYKYRQSRDAYDLLSYRLDRDTAWLALASAIDALPALTADLKDLDNSIEIETKTRQHRWTARLYYLQSNAESYTNLELKLPLLYDCGDQHYVRGDVNARVHRREPCLDPSISFTRQLYKRNIYYNASITAETKLPDITNLVGYESHRDPLCTTIGNPELKPQHTYKAVTGFVKNWPQWEQMFYAYLDASVTRNQIMPSVSYERTTGIYTRREENINGNWSSLAGVTFSRAIDKAHRWHIENAMWVTWSDLVWRGQDMNDTESSLQRIRTRHTKVDDKMKLSFRASQKFDVSLNGGIVHGLSWSNLDTYQNVRVTDITYGLAIHCTLPGAVQLASDFSMLQHSGYEYAAMNNNSSVWNVRFDKSLCHDSVTLSLMAYDILDSVQRNTWSISSAGYVNTCYNSLPRYVMLCASYRFYKAKNN